MVLQAEDELFHVTWTYHPFTLHPLVVTGGKLGLIYILDAVTRDHFRILKGHGDVSRRVLFPYGD